MPSDRRVHCVVCERHESEVGAISWSGKCSACGHERFEANLDDLHYHRGPFFLHWRRASALAVGAVLVDDVLRDD